jgi:hypothetical protein
MVMSTARQTTTPFLKIMYDLGGFKSRSLPSQQLQGRLSAHRTRRRRVLQYVVSIGEIEVAGFDSTLLVYRGMCAVCRNERQIVTYAIVHRQFRCHFPRILEEAIEQTARPCRFIHIAPVRAIGNSDQP